MDELDRRRSIQQRLHVLDALARAVERRVELLSLIGDADSADSASRALQDSWGMDELQAAAVLDLQFRRLGSLERRRIIDERDLLARDLADLERRQP